MVRRALAVSCTLLAAASAAVPAAAAGPGGTPAPAAGGGVTYGTPLKPARLVATTFAPSQSVLVAGRGELSFVVKIDGPREHVRARVELLRAGKRRAVARLDLGRLATKRRHTRTWTPPELPAGRYTARLHAVGADGRGLTRSARASGRTAIRVKNPPKPPPPPPPPVVAAPVTVGAEGVFPVRGPWTWGGDDARFGAGRPGHVHQGQDLTAPEGTPLVAPRAGTITWRAYQARGAGHYLVLTADDGRDLVFMHLQSGSPVVGRGDVVAAGQHLANVGSTGRSDGAHLHFEIWQGGWYREGGAPVDPRPQLEAWAAASGVAPAAQ